MKIIIREGSAAKNYEALHSLLKSHPEKVMFCSDDKHPHELVEGHINQIVSKSIHEKGYDLFNVLRCASLNPVEHYNLDVGLLRTGDRADFIVVDDLMHFRPLETYIAGDLVAKIGKTLLERGESGQLNNFNAGKIAPADLKIKAQNSQIQVIDAFDGELITKKSLAKANIVEGCLESDPAQDILKLVVVNRYENAQPAVAFIRNFGIKKGAIASSVAHDSHNIIAVGVSNEDIADAVNAIVTERGGISVAVGGKTEALSLPIAGLMSDRDGYEVAQLYTHLDKLAKSLGSNLQAPFMTLSFMALLVIPSLKLSDKGLFDGSAFKFTDLSLP